MMSEDDNSKYPKTSVAARESASTAPSPIADLALETTPEPVSQTDTGTQTQTERETQEERPVQDSEDLTRGQGDDEENPKTQPVKLATLSTSLSQMSIARPAPDREESSVTQRARGNSAKSFLTFLLKLNVNRSATVSGIITFLGLVVISVALHLIVIDLVGMTNVHERFDLPKWHEVAIELIPPEPEKPKEMLPPRPQQDQNAKAAPSTIAESWPIQMRQPSGARIARKSTLDTEHAQRGSTTSTIPTSPQQVASGVAEGKTDQLASVAGNSTGENNGFGSGSLFDQDWNTGSSTTLGIGLGGGGQDGSAAETERTTGRIFEFDFHKGTPLMLRFYYQTFFQPDLLPKGEIRQKLNNEWTEKKYLDNISTLEEIYDEGNYADNESYSALLYLNSFLPNGASLAYRKRFIDMAERLYGRFSFEADAAKVIVQEQDIDRVDTTREMDRLKALPTLAERDTVEAALIHRCFANCYVECKRFDDALSEYQKCLSILEQLKKNGKVKEEIAMTQISMAALQIGYLENYDQAQQLLASVKKYTDESKAHPWMVPSQLLLRGELYRKRNDSMRAEQCYKEVKDLTEHKMGSPDTIWFGLGMGARQRLEDRLR